MHTLIVGAGFSGRQIASVATRHGTVCGTRTSSAGVRALNERGIPGHVLNGPLSDDIRHELSLTTHLVMSVAPGRQPPLHDPVLTAMSSLTTSDLPNLTWIGYLSTIGVYGDHQGRWVDETTPCVSTQMRSILRREAELAWERFGGELSVPVAVLRLSGIYGYGRNAVNDALCGKARMLIKPAQVFNRIHVVDLAEATLKAAIACYAGVINITDDLPAPPQDVISFAHHLVGKSPPPACDFEQADISPMARSFYSENKRVSNRQGKQLLGIDYQFPTYKEGLTSLWAEINERF